MKFLAAIIVFLLMCAVLAWGILLAVRGSLWLLIVSLLAYVIEEIKRREREHGRDERPGAELPPPPISPGRAPERTPDDRDRDRGDRGVVIIDYSS